MTKTEFDLITAEIAKKRGAIVDLKRPDYTEDSKDVLANFKRQAEEIDISALKVWYVFFRKHVAAIASFCKDPDRKASEPIMGRVCDAMNYLELLMGLVQERNEIKMKEGEDISPPKPQNAPINPKRHLHPETLVNERGEVNSSDF